MCQIKMGGGATNGVFPLGFTFNPKRVWLFPPYLKNMFWAETMPVVERTARTPSANIVTPNGLVPLLPMIRLTISPAWHGFLERRECHRMVRLRFARSRQAQISACTLYFQTAFANLALSDSRSLNNFSPPFGPLPRASWRHGLLGHRGHRCEGRVTLPRLRSPQVHPTPPPVTR